MTEPKPKGRPPERLNVIVYFKRGFGTDPEQAEVVWPKGWPLPQPGDLVHFDAKRFGFVDHLTFDLETNRIKVETR